MRADYPLSAGREHGLGARPPEVIALITKGLDNEEIASHTSTFRNDGPMGSTDPHPRPHPCQDIGPTHRRSGSTARVTTPSEPPWDVQRLIS